MKFNSDAFINVQNVRKLVNSQGRRAGRDFLMLLNDHVRNKILSACKQHNGNIKTLGVEVASLVGIKPKGQ